MQIKVKKGGGALNRESGDTETVRFSIKKPLCNK